MTVYDYFSTDEGFNYVWDACDRIGGKIFIDEDDYTRLLYDMGYEAYVIPEGETVDDFKRAVEDSLRTGKNMLLERYKQFPDDPVEEFD